MYEEKFSLKKIQVYITADRQTDSYGSFNFVTSIFHEAII